jgi:hypothetical protein
MGESLCRKFKKYPLFCYFYFPKSSLHYSDNPSPLFLLFFFIQFTAWLVHFLATLPATIQELHHHGKRLAEEKDRAMAQHGQPQHASGPSTTHHPQNPGHPSQEQKEQQEEHVFKQHGAPLPISREYVDQSTAGSVKETHVVHGTSGAEPQFREGGEIQGGGSGGGQGESQRHGLIGKAGGGGGGGAAGAIDESGLHSAGGGGGIGAGGVSDVSPVPAEQGTSVQSRVKGDVAVDESGMHSLK